MGEVVGVVVDGEVVRAGWDERPARAALGLPVLDVVRVVPRPIVAVGRRDVGVAGAVLLGVERRAAAPALGHAVLLEVAEGRGLVPAVGRCHVGVVGEVVGVVVDGEVVRDLRAAIWFWLSWVFGCEVELRRPFVARNRRDVRRRRERGGTVGRAPLSLVYRVGNDVVLYTGNARREGLVVSVDAEFGFPGIQMLLDALRVGACPLVGLAVADEIVVAKVG